MRMTKPTVAADRRATARRPHDVWPETVREEFRKLQFLDGVEVNELDEEAWSQLIACFEGRHIRFI
ncbi:MAG TPA: hypothetical protein VIN03_23415 [Roseateles sp.]